MFQLPAITVLSVVTILSAILSFLADYAPGIAAKFDTLTISSKRLVMLIGAVLIVSIVMAGQCYGVFLTNFTCTPEGVVDVIGNIILAYVVGSGVHAGSKPSAEFKKEQLKINPNLANKKGIL